MERNKYIYWNKLHKGSMQIPKFIEKFILPYETLNLQLEYERGTMDYDTEYLIERATELGITLEK
tara:strand:+ start:627 stop:821 length:195 start_codon:yes stop_codon:yes gene_type:complete